MRRTLAILCPLAAALSAAAGCGDDDSGEQAADVCEESLRDFAPCGGDLAGRWRIEDGCAAQVELVLEGEACAQTFFLTSVDTAGTLEFAEDGAFTGAAPFAGTVDFTLDESCLLEQDGADPVDIEQTCVSLTEGIEGQGLSGSCQYTGVACLCSLGFEGAFPESGAWTSEEETVELGDGEDLPYCVSGDRLVISLPLAADAPVDSVLFRLRRVE